MGFHLGIVRVEKVGFYISGWLAAFCGMWCADDLFLLVQIVFLMGGRMPGDWLDIIYYVRINTWTNYV